MPSFVQLVANGSTVASSTSPITLGAGITTTVGNTLFAQCRMTSARTLSSVTDTQGNLWHVDTNSTSATSGVAQATCVLTTPLAAGDVVTFHCSASCTSTIGISEFAGVGSSAGVAQLDQTADLVNSAGLTVSPELGVAMSAPGELLIAAFGMSSSTATASVTAADPDTGGTWTLLAYGQGGVGGAYQIGPAGLTQSKVTWTGTSGVTSCEGQIATYLAASTPKSGTDVSGTAAEGAPKTGVNDAVGLP